MRSTRRSRTTVSFTAARSIKRSATSLQVALVFGDHTEILSHLAKKHSLRLQLKMHLHSSVWKQSISGALRCNSAGVSKTIAITQPRQQRLGRFPTRASQDSQALWDCACQPGGAAHSWLTLLIRIALHRWKSFTTMDRTPEMQLLKSGIQILLVS